MTTTKSVFGVIFCILVVAAGLTLAFHCRINMTNSMPRGLYREVNAPLKKGALVEVCLPVSIAKLGLERHYIHPGNCPGQAEPLLKQVAGLTGDEIELQQGYVAINGKRWPNSATLYADENQRIMPSIARGNYTLRQSEVWLMGLRDPRSWDSRYYGAIDQQHIKSTVEPLLTW